MQVTDLFDLDAAFEISVHQRDREEERLIIALEVREHFNHPVYHPGSQASIDLGVSVQASCCVIFNFHFSQVLIYIIG